MLYTIAETTYTPQGDDNAVFFHLVTALRCETTHTPQGDGNSFVFIFGLPDTETTYTPQGDENSPEAVALPLSPETTYTPQGDDPLERRDPHEPANRTSHLRLSAP